MHLVQAILLALLQREKTGRGQQVAVSLFEIDAGDADAGGRDVAAARPAFQLGRLPLTGAFETTDGAIVLVGAFKTNPLQDICKALGLPDLSADPRYATFEAQVADKPRIAGDVPRALRLRYHGPLARPPRRAGLLSRRC